MDRTLFKTNQNLRQPHHQRLPSRRMNGMSCLKASQIVPAYLKVTRALRASKPIGRTCCPRPAALYDSRAQRPQTLKNRFALQDLHDEVAPKDFAEKAAFFLQNPQFQVGAGFGLEREMHFAALRHSLNAPDVPGRGTWLWRGAGARRLWAQVSRRRGSRPSSGRRKVPAGICPGSGRWRRSPGATRA